jgi:hypothetical protein
MTFYFISAFISKNSMYFTTGIYGDYLLVAAAATSTAVSLNGTVKEDEKCGWDM